MDTFHAHTHASRTTQSKQNKTHRQKVLITLNDSVTNLSNSDGIFKEDLADSAYYYFYYFYYYYVH